jgi:hypothetical protein
MNFDYSYRNNSAHPSFSSATAVAFNHKDFLCYDWLRSDTTNSSNSINSVGTHLEKNTNTSVITVQPLQELITGPGPGPVFGPQVDVMTGPGPGAVFGPHVRGWNFDKPVFQSLLLHTNQSTIKIPVYNIVYPPQSFFVGYFPLNIMTGPGPGDVFGPHVRGWNFAPTRPIIIPVPTPLPFIVPETKISIKSLNILFSNETYVQFTLALLVTDHSGTPLPGATVTVFNEEDKLLFSLETNSSGLISHNFQGNKTAMNMQFFAFQGSGQHVISSYGYLSFSFAKIFIYDRITREIASTTIISTSVLSSKTAPAYTILIIAVSLALLMVTFRKRRI